MLLMYVPPALMLFAIFVLSAIWLYESGLDTLRFLLKCSASIYLMGKKVYTRYNMYMNGALNLVQQRDGMYVYTYISDKLKSYTLAFKQHSDTLLFLEDPDKYLDSPNICLYAEMSLYTCNGTIDTIDVTEFVNHFIFYNTSTTSTTVCMIEYALNKSITEIHQDSVLSIYYTNGDEKEIKIKELKY